MYSLGAILKDRVDLTPDAACIIHMSSGTELSYKEVLETARKLSAILADFKVGKKDRVAFMVSNHWLLFPLLIACTSRRATLVPVDPDLHRDELSFILTNAAPALVISLDGAGLANLKETSKFLSLTDIIKLIEDSTSAHLPEESVPSDVGLMIYTSGTTGTNKCVMLTEANLVANAISLVNRYKINTDDRFFCIMPTYHMNAIMITGIVPLVAGARIYLSDVLSFKNAKHYWKNLNDRGITVCSLVPSIMALLLKLFPGGANATIMNTMRFGFCGAAPLPSHTWKQFEEVFGFPIYQGYGLTETTCWAVSSPPDEPRGWDSVGIPLDCCEIRIDHSQIVEIETFLFDSNSLRDPVDREEASSETVKYLSGEVLISGPIVGPGYYKNPKLTKETKTPEGFFRTGDLGFFDTTGHLHISGRLKEIIIKNGDNIFSNDIDRILLQHESVEKAKTIGIRDELVGERICSACVIKKGHSITELELRSWVQERISHHMWPDSLIFMGYLPGTAAGKISINILRKIVSKELTEEILSSLQSWKYKRSQPSGLDEIRATVQSSLIHGTPIHFLSYWGCGKRDSISDLDRQALDRLHDYVNGVRRVSEAPPKLTIIFTDIHARNNRIPLDRMYRYFEAIRNYISGMPCAENMLLSDFWNMAELTPSKISEALRNPEIDEEWMLHPLRERLIEQGSKHVENSGDAESAAKLYWLACRKEGEAIVQRYPSSIFVTYNHPDFDCMSPNLPKVYLSSYKEGTSVKPWFVE